MAKADLLIVMGTSLVVQPFASMVADVGDDPPRLLVNRERVGHSPAAKAAERAAERRADGGAGGWGGPAASSGDDSSASASDDDDDDDTGDRRGPDGSVPGDDTSDDASDSGSDAAGDAGGIRGGFDFGLPGNRRDAVHLGNADDAAWQLAALLGWSGELEAAIKSDAAQRAAAAAEGEE